MALWVFDDEKRKFLDTRIFQYRRKRKIIYGMILIVSLVFLFLLAVFYIGVLRHSDMLIVRIFNSGASHISYHLMNSTILGVLYTSLIGGLFFVFMPLEVLLARFLSAGNPFALVFLIYMLGIVVSYSLNYFIGFRLSWLAKKLISPKQFYSLKSRINRYGGIAIYALNVLPLPSQILAAVLGVFKYNKTRFYFYLVLGHLTKIVVIAIGVYRFSH